MWGQAVTLKIISSDQPLTDARIDGRWIGMLHVRKEGRQWLEEALRMLQSRANFSQLGLPDLLNALVVSGKPVHVWYVHGHWLDVNSVKDLESAGTFTAGA